MPGTNVRAMEKAPALGADVVFLDLEDAVAPDDKERARANVIEALGAHDWSGCAISVRINGLDTHWCYRDVVEVVEARGDVLDTRARAEGRLTVATWSSSRRCSTRSSSATAGRAGRIGIHILIETAAGMANVEAIARARPDRLEAMVFGVADYAASVQARTTNIGGANPDYSVLTDPGPQTGAREIHWGDQWHFGISRMVAACRAHGPASDRRPVRRLRRRRRLPQRRPPRGSPGVRGEVGDPSRRRSSSRTRSSRRPRPRSSAPSASCEAMEEGAKEGKGAVSLDGRLIDAASIRMAENLMRKVEQMRARRGDAT